MKILKRVVVETEEAYITANGFGDGKLYIVVRTGCTEVGLHIKSEDALKIAEALKEVALYESEKAGRIAQGCSEKESGEKPEKGCGCITIGEKKCSDEKKTFKGCACDRGFET